MGSGLEWGHFALVAFSWVVLAFYVIWMEAIYMNNKTAWKILNVIIFGFAAWVMLKSHGCIQ